MASAAAYLHDERARRTDRSRLPLPAERSRCDEATTLSCSRRRGSARRRCLRCCTRWRPSIRRGRCGGCTAPGTEPSTPSRRRVGVCSPGCRARTPSSVTANPTTAIASATTTRYGGTFRLRRSRVSRSRRTRTPISADRSASWTSSRRTCRAWGSIAARIFTERFGAHDAITPGVVGQATVPPHLPAGPAGTGPAVSFARSNLTANWGAGYASLLELRRSVRRARAVVVSHRRVPHV